MRVRFILKSGVTIEADCPLDEGEDFDSLAWWVGCNAEGIRILDDVIIDTTEIAAIINIDAQEGGEADG